MNLLDVLSDPRTRDDRRALRFGVVIGIVSNNQDPEKLGRVKVKFPWLVEDDESNWARVASPMAGPDRGVSVLPDVDDEVLVAFENGDPRSPFVLGALWNGVDKPPSEKDGDGENNLLVVKSRSGHLVVLDDTSGAEKIEIRDKTEKNRVVIESASNAITIEADGDITLTASKGTITLDAKTIAVKSSADAKVEAGSTLDLKASATLTVKGATVNIN
jgi:uncharacterized protein involved in type VI secretion and phage assembly